MPGKNYPQFEEQPGPQEAATDPATERLLTPLSQAINELTQAVAQLQNQLQQQTPQPAPNPFQGTAAENAVDVFSSILAGLQLQPTPPIPTIVKAEATSPTQIKLEWIWSGRGDEVDGFKIWRCQGQDCEGFVEIEKKVLPDARNYEDHDVTSGQTYRYKLTAFKFRRESAFSNIVDAKT